MDLVALYTQTQDRIVDLVSPLSSAALARPVPGTPRWTVVELVSHLTGVCHDVGGGVVEGAGDEPWTARQVSARAGRSLPALLAEWRDRTPALLACWPFPGGRTRRPSIS